MTHDRGGWGRGGFRCRLGWHRWFYGDDPVEPTILVRYCSRCYRLQFGDLAKAWPPGPPSYPTQEWDGDTSAGYFKPHPRSKETS